MKNYNDYYLAIKQFYFIKSFQDKLKINIFDTELSEFDIITYTYNISSD